MDTWPKVSTTWLYFIKDNEVFVVVVVFYLCVAGGIKHLDTVATVDSHIAGRAEQCLMMHIVTLRYSNFSEAENTLNMLLISGRRLNQFILLPNIAWAGTERLEKKKERETKVLSCCCSFVDSLLRHIVLQVSVWYLLYTVDSPTCDCFYSTTLTSFTTL